MPEHLKRADTGKSEPFKSEPFVSVIIPVHNGGGQLGQCLEAIQAAQGDFEIIVVDDCSTDESVHVARRRGVRVLQLESRSGPAAARNRGALLASGGVLLFVDSDVLVKPSTVARVAAHFQEKPRLAALFGSYDDAPAATNFISQYKNLLHHFVHQQGSREAGTFWAGCGAVRREIFFRVGGFNERLYRAPSIEDIELGYRLRDAGFDILMDEGLQVCHLKRWTFVSLLRTDIFRRAAPWSKLILERGRIPADLNLRVRERLSALATISALTLLALSLVSPSLLSTALLLLATVFFLNRKLYAFFWRRRGLLFLIGAVTLHLLYYCYSTVVFALCRLSHIFRRKSVRPLVDERGQSARA
jgi:glycosyltransferase involved in cell wall biosynthesis